MYETVELSNSCEAVLSDEVAKYEDLMDKAAEDNGLKRIRRYLRQLRKQGLMSIKMSMKP